MQKVKKSPLTQTRSRSGWVVMWILVAVFILYSISLLFPFAWVLWNSFKTTGNFNKDIWGVPSPFVISNYIEVFSMRLPVSGVSIAGMFGNTLIFICTIVPITLFLNAISAYIVAKYDYKIMKVIHSIALIFMVVPTFGSVAAIYRFYVDSGLYNTYIGVILLSVTCFNSTFLFFHAYYQNVSWTYAEAAFMDGASHFRVFFSIMLPMSVPIIGALGILSVVGVWNDFFTVYMYAPNLSTIGVGLNELSKNIRGQYPRLFALMVISLIPVITVFAVFQKTIMENVSFGGIKG